MYTGNYLFPPRPKKAIPSQFIKLFARKGWVGQYKKNGTCNVTIVNNGDIEHWNRHGEPHKQWNATPASDAIFELIPKTGFWVFISELLHNKVSTVRDTLYFFDVIVAHNEFLDGSTFEQRQKLLFEVFQVSPGETEEDYSHYIVTPNAWIAKTIPSDGMRDAWNYANDHAPGLDNGAPLDEGIVLKNPNGCLESCSKENNNSDWQVKARVLNKNYGF